LPGYILENNGTARYKSAGGDGPMLRIVHRRVNPASACAALGCLRLLTDSTDANEQCDGENRQGDCWSPPEPHAISALCS
jgi:hypothetical protein